MLPPHQSTEPTLPATLPPQLPLAPSVSHPTSLQPSVLQGRESVSLLLCDELWKIAGIKQTAAPDEKHRCHGAGAASITHSGKLLLAG